MCLYVYENLHQPISVRVGMVRSGPVIVLLWDLKLLESVCKSTFPIITLRAT